MAIDTQKVTAFINALKAKFEAKANKVTAWSQEPSDDKYPSEKLVKNGLDSKLNASDVPTKTSDLTNDGDGSNAFITEHATVDANLSNASTNAIQNATVTTALSNKEDTSNKITAWGNNPTDTQYPSAKLVKDEIDSKLGADSVPTKTSDLTNDGEGVSGKPFLTEHQSLSDIGGVITITKATADIGDNVARYTFQQGGSNITNGIIDIPKDFLVKSGTVKTVTAQDLSTLGQGYTTGDKYIDFVINTKGNDGTDEHMYINVKDLVEDTTYSADDATITLSSGTFAVKNGGIGTTQLSSGVVTSLGYADSYHNSPAAAIETSDINAWNAHITHTVLTESDVESKIEAYLTSITNELNGVTTNNE